MSQKRERCKVEQTIGILKQRWSCLRFLRMQPHKCCKIVVACCALHNFCLDLRGFDAVSFDGDDSDNDDDNIGDGRNVLNDAPQTRQNIIDAYFNFYA